MFVLKQFKVRNNLTFNK